MTILHSALAILERMPDGIIVVRIKQGVTMTAEGFAELLNKRKLLAGGKPAGVVIILPGNADFDLSVMNVDHHAGQDVGAFTKAMAIVTQGTLHARLTEVYFKHFPPDFKLQLFSTEAEAMAWVRQHMAVPVFRKAQAG